MIELTVRDTSRGERLDRYLARELPQFSRVQLQRSIRSGLVRVNGEAVRPRDAVRSGDRIAIADPPVTKAAEEAENIPLKVLFEDDDLLVINKPAGLVVHPAAGNPDRTLVNALLAHCGDSLRGIGGVMRPGIVHRIDKDTSGLIVAAKTEAAHASLGVLSAVVRVANRSNPLASLSARCCNDADPPLVWQHARRRTREPKNRAQAKE